jgi:hypothetical protein
MNQYLEPLAGNAHPTHPVPPPPANFVEAQQFLRALDPTSGRHTFQTFDDSGKRSHLARIFHGTLEEHFLTLSELNKLGAGVFVTINATNLVGRKSEDIQRVRAVFADFDGEPSEDFRTSSLNPQIVVGSSPGRTHAYWLVSGLPLEQFEHVQQSIALRYGGDPAVKDRPRVMRLPGFDHKKGMPYRTRLLHVGNSQPYSAHQVLAAFSPQRLSVQANSVVVHQPILQIEQKTYDDLVDALTFLRPHASDRSFWIAIGACLRELGDVGRDLWMGWSKSSEKWKEGDIQIWQTISWDRAGYRGVFSKAQHLGWVNPRSNAAQASLIDTSALRQVDLTDFTTGEPKPPKFAIAPIVPTGVVTLLSGHGGVGKSTLALTLAAHYAAHRSFGPYTFIGGPVAFVSLEDNGDVIRYRLRLIVEQFQLDSALIQENLLVLDAGGGDGALVVEKYVANVRQVVETANAARLRAWVKGRRLIVVDNASDAYDADENSRRQVRRFMSSLGRVAQQNEAGIILLSHIDKATARSGAQGNAYSGSTAWHNSARSRIALLEDNGGITLSHEKSNFGARAEILRFSKMLNGLLVPAGEGQEDQYAKAARELIGIEDGKIILTSLRRAVERGVNVPPGRQGALTAQKALERAGGLLAGLQGNSGSNRFWRALDRLIDHGQVIRESYTTKYRKPKIRLVPNARANANGQPDRSQTIV